MAIIVLFVYKRRQGGKLLVDKQLFAAESRARTTYFGDLDAVGEVRVKEKISDDTPKQQPSPYDSNLIVLQIDAFSGKPYMGYELHQALLSSGLRFGEMGLFYRYQYEDKGNVLFSLAAATADGSFVMEKIGSFKCNGLLLFMRLEPKKKLMTSFDLMLDTARQLVEELGGEIYDDLHQPINAGVIKGLRERICVVETSNLYASDLLDNLD